MNKAKLTRDDLREMKPGETKAFSLENAQACDSAKATVYQMQNLLQCKFTVSTDYANNVVSVTRL